MVTYLPRHPVSLRLAGLGGGTAVTASGARSAAWVAAVFGITAALLTGGLLIDVLRHR